MYTEHPKMCSIKKLNYNFVVAETSALDETNFGSAFTGIVPVLLCGDDRIDVSISICVVQWKECCVSDMVKAQGDTVFLLCVPLSADHASKELSCLVSSYTALSSFALSRPCPCQGSGSGCDTGALLELLQYSQKLCHRCAARW